MHTVSLRIILIALFLSSTALSLPTFAALTAPPMKIFYVSPNGSGTTCSEQSPCALEKARELVRQLTPSMQSDSSIYLADGTYELNQPLTFGSNDGGTNGYYVNYYPMPGASPVISGGKVISGWTLADSAKNIYKASVPVGFDTRQLYVDGVRATRARVVLQEAQGLGGGVSATNDGYQINSVNMNGWGNIRNVEFVSRSMWRHHRCPVDSVIANRQHTLYRSHGAGFSLPYNDVYSRLSNTNYQFYVGDFNGDGKSDFLSTYLDSAGVWHNDVFATTPGGLTDPSNWLPNAGRGTTYHLGDFNGDGKTDLLFAGKDDKNVWHNYVALSTGSGFAMSKQDWLTNQGQGTKYYIGDFDGNGKSDLLFYYRDNNNYGRFAVALSTGSSFQPSVDWFTPPLYGFLENLYVGDFNGDRKTDLLLTHIDDGGVWHNDVSLSNGSSFNRLPAPWLNNVGQGATYYVGDFNGDSKSDLLFAWNPGGVRYNTVALANTAGTGFNPPANWHTNNEGKDAAYYIVQFDDDKKSDLFFFKGQNVKLQSLCWTNANTHASSSIMSKSLNWIENAYELLDEPGEWYLDKTNNLIFYIPRSGEDMRNSKFVAGRLEQLMTNNLTTSGSQESFGNVRFYGLTFAYATWIEPNSSAGFADYQAGIRYSGGINKKTLGNISFAKAKDVHFIGNQFLHLGGIALNLDKGSQRIVIKGNVFSDISSGAVAVGDITDITETDVDLQNKDFTIANNIIQETGVEYEGSVGIFLSIVANANITQNEISHLPYSAIMLGWAWNNYTTYARENTISQNWIHDILKTMRDGAGIYTLGSQPNSKLDQNVIENIGPVKTCPYDPKEFAGYAGIYHDNGSQYFTDTKNIVRNFCGYWLMLQGNPYDAQNQSYYNKLNDNYVDFDRVYCSFTAGASPICNFNNNLVSNLRVGPNGKGASGAGTYSNNTPRTGALY